MLSLTVDAKRHVYLHTAQELPQSRIIFCDVKNWGLRTLWMHETFANIRRPLYGLVVPGSVHCITCSRAHILSTICQGTIGKVHWQQRWHHLPDGASIPFKAPSRQGQNMEPLMPSHGPVPKPSSLNPVCRKAPPISVLPDKPQFRRLNLLKNLVWQISNPPWRCRAQCSRSECNLIHQHWHLLHHHTRPHHHKHRDEHLDNGWHQERCFSNYENCS